MPIRNPKDQSQSPLTETRSPISRSVVFFALMGVLPSLHADITITGSFNRTAAEWESGSLTTNAFLANNGDGMLIVDGGSTLNLIGNTNLFGTGQAMPPNEATVIITDVGSEIFTVNGLTIGNNTGVGTVSILNGARLQTTGRAELGGGGNLGDSSTSSGSVTVDGSGSSWEANGGINVGQFAQGALTIQNEGGLTATELFVARGVNAVGLLEVIGNGPAGSSELTLNDTLTVEEGGSALISNGASVDAGTVLSVSGTATVEGVNTSMVSSDFAYISSADRNAVLFMSDGAQGSTDQTILGSDTGDGSSNSGTLTVEGNGTSWTSLRNVTIGSANGDGVLNILNGATVTVINTNQEVRVRNGAVNLLNGVIVAAQVDATGPSSLTIQDGTIRLTDNQVALFNGFADGDVALNSGVATIDTQSFAASTDVVFNGSGGVNKQGSGSLTLSGASNNNGATTVTDGSLFVNNTTGSATGSGSVTVNSGALLGGDGTIGGIVTSAGTVAPGNSAGTLTILGNYTQEAGSLLQLEIGGTTPGLDYDVLSVNGPIGLNGTIDVQLINDYTPSAGEQFTLITSSDITDLGVNITLPTLPALLSWQVTLDSTSLALEVISLNEPPVADDQTITSNEDISELITLTASDLDGQPLAFSIASGPTNGSLGTISQVDSTSVEVAYTPAADFFGSDSFTFFVNDGFEDSAWATVSITVQPVNDQPNFMASDPAPVNEDRLLVNIPGWALFDPGASNESGQVIASWEVTNVSNPALFSGGSPGPSNSGDLTFIPNGNAFGTSTFDVAVRDSGGTDNGGIDTSVTQTFTITINPVNDRPSFSASNPVAIDENAGPQALMGWASFDPGPDNESDQEVLAYLVDNISSSDLFAVPPSVDVDGNLTYTPAPDANGTSTFDVRVQDDGGTANQGNDLSVTQTFTIIINPINNAPTFTASDPDVVLEDSSSQIVSGWATFDPGADNEANQVVVAYTVSNISNPALFTFTPGVTVAGDLTFALFPDANGSSTFDVVVQDDGGTANGGQDSSVVQTFTITVDAVNDAPSLSASDPIAINEDAGPQTVTDWATFDPGPDNESDQTVDVYLVSAVDPVFFAAGPAVDTDGNLSYTVADDANGISSFVVEVRDSGGTDNGGVDLSPFRSYTVTVNEINDPPSFVAVDPAPVVLGSGTQEIADWATFDPGPFNESSQSALAYTVSNISDPTLFDELPTVDQNGVLRYTPNTASTGTSTFDVIVQDDGGTANGGEDTSQVQTFTIVVRSSDLFSDRFEAK